MARTVKPQQERRDEILGAAKALFFSDGYEATSVNRIIEMLGISKGAFYHHFKSKEDVLDELVEQLTRAQVDAMRALLDDPRLDALDKLNGFYAGAGSFKREHAGSLRTLMQVMYRPDNLLLRHRMAAASVRAVTPALSAIIAQGVRERLFDCASPGHTAELILGLGTLLSDSLAAQLGAAPEDVSSEVVLGIEERVLFYEQAVERLLGAERGTVRIIQPGVIAAICGLRRAGAPSAS